MIENLPAYAALPRLKVILQVFRYALCIVVPARTQFELVAGKAHVAGFVHRAEGTGTENTLQALGMKLKRFAFPLYGKTWHLTKHEKKINLVYLLLL